MTKIYEKVIILGKERDDAMNLIVSTIDDIDNYNPYVDLNDYFGDKYFEDKFVKYLNDFKVEIEKLKDKLGHKIDRKIDKIFLKIIKKRNNDIVIGLLNHYPENLEYSNEENIRRLKQKIRSVKNMILVSEPANMKRLNRIDKQVDTVIDFISSSFNYSLGINDEKLEKILNSFYTDNITSFDDYSNYVLEFKQKIMNLYDYYRNNYSIDTAVKKIRKLNIRVTKLLDTNAYGFGYYRSQLDKIDLLVSKYKNMDIGTGVYDYWLDDFRREINELKELFLNSFSKDMAKKLINILDKKVGIVLDDKIVSFSIDKLYEDRCKDIFNSYKPDEIDIFDLMFYSDELERKRSIDEYEKMTKEEKLVFEMRIYEQYIRYFKGKIRKYNGEIRRIYSNNSANRIVNSINKRADKLICNTAKKVGKPVPKNPWFVRKYLWADSTSFVSDRGIKFRKLINPILRNIVKIAMKNKLIIEERPKLDSTKQYIFVSTHYFTEDVIGLFSSIGRQAYMLMGTTDQIENNPLMIAAMLFGFFHVDRMDPVNRKETLEKQNKIIEYDTSVINYISGSWENSENELQPLSFSGPYRTSKKMNVEIVPIASYLVREKKEIYIRYGEPLDLSNYDEDTANLIIRDTLASMHFKQMSKHCIPIDAIEIEGYGKTHNLPYDQHIYYMEQIGNEYWNQPWSKPFAKEEIGVRTKKDTQEEDVYSFVDNLSRQNLIKLSGIISEPLVRRYEKNDRYNIVKYIDDNYDRFKNNNGKIKVRKK